MRELRMNRDKYLKKLDNLGIGYYDVKSAVEDIEKGSFEKLNYTSRVLAENLLRKCPSDDLESSLKQIIEQTGANAIELFNLASE